MSALFSDRCRSLPERCTGLYLITMLLIFPLYPGFAGYSEITAYKFFFFAVLTCVWLVFCAAGILLTRRRLALGTAQYAALLWLAVLLLSWLFSPDRRQALLGAGRYDGLLTNALYALIFLGVSLFGSRRMRYAQALAASVSLCAVIALLQLAGYDPLHLYPEGVSYADAGLLYTGVFLGTIGNTNILDAVLCLALPISLALYVCGKGVLFLLPPLLCTPVILHAGGDGARLSLWLALLIALPLLLTDAGRGRRTLFAAAVLLFAASFSSLWTPEEASAFAYSPAVLLPAAAGTLCLLAALIFKGARRPLSAKQLRTLAVCISVLLPIAVLISALLLPPRQGTLYELHETIRGHGEGSFGSSRLQIWRACLDLVPEHLLLGGGPGTLALRLDIHFSRYVPETGVTLRSFVDNSHNVYLGALCDTGLLGLLSLLGVMLCSAVSGWKRRDDPLALALSLGALCCCIHEFFGLGLCISSPLLWIILALLNVPDPQKPESDTEAALCRKKI